jgi:DNA-3-methyladenine glycosylase II
LARILRFGHGLCTNTVATTDERRMIPMSKNVVATMAARGPFRLDAALQWIDCFPAVHNDGPSHVYRRAHVLGKRPLVVQVSQHADECLKLEVFGHRVTQAERKAAASLVRRVLSLDLDGDFFYGELARQDSVLASLQATYPGLRPVLFGSPFEALCWAILGQRIRMSQAAVLKARFAEALGPTLTWAGQTYRAFPAPADVAAMSPDKLATELRISSIKLERLVHLAERGVEGHLNAERLVAMPIAETKAWLMQSPGVGPWAAEFTLIRAVGVSALLPEKEARLYQAISHAYGLNVPADSTAMERLKALWGSCQSWAAFLLRVSLQDEVTRGSTRRFPRFSVNPQQREEQQ